MDENNNVNLEENVSVESETEKAESKILHVDKSKHVFDIVYLAFCSAFTLIMWCTGYNFLPLVCDILGIVAGVLVFARLLSKKNVGLYLWISYIVCMCGLFVYFLIWGAESFGKNLWYNFVLVLFPVLLATFVYLADKVLKKQLALRITCAVCHFLWQARQSSTCSSTTCVCARLARACKKVMTNISKTSPQNIKPTQILPTCL